MMCYRTIVDFNKFLSEYVDQILCVRIWRYNEWALYVITEDNKMIFIKEEDLCVIVDTIGLLNHRKYISYHSTSLLWCVCIKLLVYK